MVNDASYRLDGQKGMVIGGAGGIGRAIAVGLAAAGSDVAIADLASRESAMAEVAEEARAQGAQAMEIAIDVTCIPSIEQAVARVVEEFGAVDWMVNCAGVNVRKPVLDYVEQDWDLMADINLKGTFFCTQIVARQMARQHKGRIVNLASQLAVVAMRDRSIYAITKAAVAHLSKAFAIELAPLGIAVNAVGPTFVATPLTQSMFTDPEFIRENLPRIPAGRFGTPEDVLGTVRFLLSPAADLINGQLILVEGGYTSW